MTGIMATIGPASNRDDVIEAFMQNGVRRFRFALSKETPEWINRTTRRVRRAARGLSDVQIFIDLPGSKPRLTNDDFFTLELGREYVLDLGSDLPDADLRVAGLRLRESATPGDIVVVGDGEDAFEVLSVRGNSLLIRSLTAGTLGKRRGIAILGKAEENEAGTDAEFALLKQVDLADIDGVILSFCETAESVRQCRDRMTETGVGRANNCIVMGKIETEAGVINASAIAQSADEIMLGRGDLLLSTGPLKFFESVKHVEKAVRTVDTPLTVATELLSSMTHRWLPARSELTEVSRLVSEGCDWFMLSNETAASPKPVEIVVFLRSIILQYGER
ncbi:hypothetical protein G6L08_22590 [Agrobacterium rhizogenes]|nr:hypothetical protein [Rhizobium rhizogenes]